MNIVICDDDMNTLDNLKSIIESLLDNDIKIWTFNNGSALEIYIDDNIQDNLDILFMDIDLGNEVNYENGIEIANRIKLRYPKIKIIFITGYIEYSQDIFEAEPTYFLVKPFKIDKVKNALNIAIKSAEDTNPKILSLLSKNVVVNIPLNKIRYIESVKRQVIIHQNCNDDVVYGKLKDIESLLPQNFIRCHQSYIVNMDKVEKLTLYSFLLNNGENISISQSKYNKTKTMFLKYLGNAL